MLTSIIIFVFYLNWNLALISLISAPFIAYLATKLEKEIGNAFDKISDQAAAINTTAQENISGFRLVKAFSREKHEILKFLKLNNENYNLNILKSKIWGKYYPRILILDETTSNIDTNTEKLVHVGIKKLLKGKTSFIIAHRLSTIINADKIFYIDKGKII